MASRPTGAGRVWPRATTRSRVLDLGIDLARDRNKVDFARAALGVLFKF